MSKVYVDIIAEFTADGDIHPREIVWNDGRRFRIDRILDARRAVSLKAGGVGMRYLCSIDGKNRYVYYEDNNKWFVEGRQ